MPADQPDDAALAPVARELYVVVPAQFVATRNSRATHLRQAGDPALAARVRALPKPTPAAWAVGAVVRALPGELDALEQLGAELRVAQASGNAAELRALSRRRRELTARVTRVAARLADEHGVVLSAAAQQQVEGTWLAVVLDGTARRAVRAGLLVRAVEPGVEVDLAHVLAVPNSVRPQRDDGPFLLAQPRGDGVGGAPADLESAGSDGERTIPPSGRGAESAEGIRRAQRDLRLRERAAAQAEAELANAEVELTQQRAEALQVAARVEEARRALAEHEGELTELEETRADAEQVREDAADQVTAAERQIAVARARLRTLEE